MTRAMFSNGVAPTYESVGLTEFLQLTTSSISN